MEVFLTNAFLYIVWFAWCYKQKSEYSAFYLFSIGLYAVVSCMGAYVFDIGLYQEEIRDSRSLEYLSYLPYFLMFIMMMGVMSPLKVVPKFEIGWDAKRVSLFSKIFLFFMLGHLFFFLEGYQLGAASDLGDAYHMSVSGDLGQKYGSDIEMILSKVFRRLSICVMPIFLYLQFYRIVKNQKSMMALFLLIVGFGATVTPSVLQGSRGSLFFNFFALVYIYTNFKDEIPVDIKKKIYGIAFAVLGLLGFYAIIISFARVDGDVDVALNRIMRYFGEPFLNLGLVYWDSTDIHTYGLRFFPKLLEWFGGFELPDSKYGVDAVREFWSNVYRVNMYYFKTLFGDLYLEFGTIGAFVVALLTIAAGWLAKKISNPLLSHFLLYYYARVIVLWGIFGYGFLQDVFIDLSYAIVFWLLIAKFWNPSTVEDKKDKSDAEKAETGETDEDDE